MVPVLEAQGVGGDEEGVEGCVTVFREDDGRVWIGVVADGADCVGGV